MQKLKFLPAVLLPLLCTAASGQAQRTSVPIGDAVTKALSKISLTSEGARPFHIRVSISEPENPQSPYHGTIEEWWVSPNQWRREVTADGLQQTIVVVDGKKTERDEGDYFPLWLRSFVTATFDPIPNAAAWTASGISIEQITMPNGAKSDACARAKSKIGSGEAATDAFSNVCFDGEGRVGFFGSPRYSMEFKDYKSFGKRQVARKLIDHPEPGTELVGEITALENANTSADNFAPLPTDDNRFQSAMVNPEQMERLSSGNPAINWPPVHSGNLHGRLAIYVSVDAAGHVREAWPLNSDNAGLDDSVRAQVMQWTMKPAVDAGKRVQVDGGLGFSFETKIGDPLPELSDAEVRDLATKIVEPVWPSGGVHSGQVFEVQVSVDQTGKLAGFGFAKVAPAAQGAVMNALHEWQFRPLMRDGKPQYFHGTVKFTVP